LCYKPWFLTEVKEWAVAQTPSSNETNTR